jgi:hypothetical protein
MEQHEIPTAEEFTTGCTRCGNAWGYSSGGEHSGYICFECGYTLKEKRSHNNVVNQLRKNQPVNARAQLLFDAESAVNGDRNAQYGDPKQDFRRTADMWSAYLGIPVEMHDVAAMMMLLKVSRIRWSPEKYDSWMDAAGYAACGWDCAKPPEVAMTERIEPKFAPNVEF